MKKLSTIILVCLLGLMGCVGTPNQITKTSPDPTVLHRSELVTLVLAAKCDNYHGSAIPISSNILVTAAHTITKSINDSKNLFKKGDDVAITGFKYHSQIVQEKFTASAKVLAIDDNLDIAILKMNNGFKFNKWFAFNISVPPLGSKTYAVGFPPRSGPSMAEGIASKNFFALADDQKTQVLMIESDCDIFGGWSGGALLNEKGELIGLLTKVREHKTFSMAVSSIFIYKFIVDNKLKLK